MYIYHISYTAWLMDAWVWCITSLYNFATMNNGTMDADIQASLGCLQLLC